MTKNPDWQPCAQAGQGARRNCPCLAGRAHSWKQALTLTACIMGVLAALGAALVAILGAAY